ncbi:hypothetical protein MRX96_046633 [Rhipicephalus microplus]
MGKLQRFYDEISKCLRQFGVFNESLSIDESMVPYYGHHSCKMFTRGWLLHCELHKGSDAAMTHIAFRRDVPMSLLQLKQ